MNNAYSSSDLKNSKNLAGDIRGRCENVTAQESIGAARGFYVALMSQVVATLFFYGQPVMSGWLMSLIAAAPGIAFSYAYLRKHWESVAAKKEVINFAAFNILFYWYVLGSLKIVLWVTDLVGDGLLKVFL